VLSIKLYRLTLDPAPALPTLPCLDHEAMLHDGIPPHAAAYVQDAASGDLHELVLSPRSSRNRYRVHLGEHSPESFTRLQASGTVPQHRVRMGCPGGAASAVWRPPVAQVSLRAAVQRFQPREAAIDRLQVVGSLMERSQRIPWGVRTVTGPLLAGVGVVLYSVLGGLTPRLGEAGVTALRYAIVGLLGAWFLYYGLKAVQLTEMSNRVWKRTAEYNLILSERQRLAKKA
jgi:hypothetical protein